MHQGRGIPHVIPLLTALGIRKEESKHKTFPVRVAWQLSFKPRFAIHLSLPIFCDPRAHPKVIYSALIQKLYALEEGIHADKLSENVRDMRADTSWFIAICRVTLPSLRNIPLKGFVHVFLRKYIILK